MSNSDKPVIIAGIAVQRSGDSQLLSATVDGDEIWYRFPGGLSLTPRAEAFLAPALFEAMIRGVPLIVDDDSSISPRLAARLATIQSIFRCWNPELSVVDIHAAFSIPSAAMESSVCCFSGGVDSTYTFVRNQSTISHLLLVQGFDTWKRPEEWAANVEARTRFAKSVGRDIIAVDSNVRDFIERRGIYWGLALGGVLANLGITVAPRTFFIPSSWTYRNLHPYGSHPLVDPLWSTEATAVVHHGGETSRSEKIEACAKSQQLLDQLQVCWKSCAANCGECPKCIRTSLALHLMGNTSKGLSSFHSMKQLRRLRPDGEAALAYVEDLIMLCRRVGDSRIQARLLRMRKHFLMKDSMEKFINALTGEWGRRVDRTLRPREWRSTRATLRPKNTPF
jgi:hypothetical protein